MIKQARISKSISKFSDGFRSLWELSEYTDKEAPAVFFGVYTKEDIIAINKHEGFKLIIFGGVDFANCRKIRYDHIVTDLFCYSSIRKRLLKPETKFVKIPNRDFRKIETIKEKGRFVYCYSNKPESGHHYHFGLIDEIKKHFDVIEAHQGNSPEKVLEMYQSSFCNLQLNPTAGFTTAVELAHMGIPSVSNHPSPWSYSFNDMRDILHGIQHAKESDPETISYLAQNYFDYSGDWLNIDFWND